ncbi:[protein-PII] uridylyltransferase [Limnobacter sp.]|uniref:[protein-PII] uridylyltransferase n=1 Tax=Limnobacter sp. TaxID=2003368 RepID=UPI0025C2156F|nr:[protein-PII] uridylyltransferase [Limnobacter sp.]MDZ4051092.1 [protein-PII] uridylyltransferase [Limnobacter sp.]
MSNKPATTVDKSAALDLNAVRVRIKTQLKSQAHQWLTPFDQNTPASAVEAVLRKRCVCVDEALVALWNAIGMPKQYSLVAVGGYGRGELFPFSDVDVLILIDQEPDEVNTEKLETFCGSGWDIGLEIGHSVRTPKQCVEEAGKDITVQTALVESRFLAGNSSNFRALNSTLQKLLEVKTFFRKKTLELRQRHAKYQETPYSLEPNCKESPGGLRDLHVISWVCRAANLGNSWAEMAKKGLITPFEAAKLRNNERTLKKIRYQLHVTTGRREDRLVYDVQTQLAESLGYRPTAAKRSSEQLMQQYYLAAKAVMQLNTILLQNIELSIFGSNAEPVVIDDEFQETDSLLDIRDDEVFARNPSAMLRAFIVMQQNPRLKGMSARMLRQLWHSRVKINSDFRKNPVNKALFIEFFKQPQGIVHELRRMNETSVLGRYLPVFRKIVGQMQHDLFHVYTVDQHILTVVRNLRRFTMAEHAHEYPYCSQLMANFDDHWLLYVAALFHDVAKGRGGDHSVLGEVDARKFCKDHGLNQENTDLVAFLVKHHLTMSNTAQKKDLSDVEVLKEFAALVKTPRNLTALYLLTVADIRGTSPKVWNAWKGKLLEDLYRLTLKYLGGEAPNRRQMLAEQQAEARRILRLYALSDDVQDKLWAQLDVSYFLRQGPSDIAWHTRHLYWRVDTEQPIVKARLSPIGEGLELLVYTRDEMDLFARICGYFDSKNLSILDAKIHTTSHGYALDSFLIQHDSHHEFYRETLSLLEAELQDRLIKRQPLEPPVFGRMSRQSRHFPVRPSVDLKPDEKGNQYLLTVSATDRTGLLYSITRLLAQYKVNVQTAKIMTLGERAEDTFLLYGQSLNSGKLQIQLEAELLELLSI